MLESLRADVCEANLALVRHGLVTLTWGNASAIDRDRGLVVIKPSGVPYESMRPEHMVITDMSGKIVEGSLRPSVDLPSHLVLYAAWPAVGGVVHTHSHYATCWAQVGLPIPCFGTTHADLAHGPIPVTETLTKKEVAGDYERSIGEAIVRCFHDMDPMHCPAVLSAKHAPFTWGATVAAAVDNAVALEESARMACHTLQIARGARPLPKHLLDKHFLRKHGKDAYYGQK